jgi:hypothetical protein
VPKVGRDPPGKFAREKGDARQHPIPYIRVDYCCIVKWNSSILNNNFITAAFHPQRLVIEKALSDKRKPGPETERRSVAKK